MNKTRKNRRRSPGQALVEFTLVGIPIIFVLISIFEVSRGMWLYHTLAYSAKVGVRYASVHGINCIGSAVNPKLQNPNDCAVKMGPADTQGTVAYVIRQAAVGLDPTKTTITFIDSGTPVTCNLDVSGGASSGGVGPCPGTIWPTYDPSGISTFNLVGEPIRIDITTPFNSAIAMFWPGAKNVSFARGTLGATSQDYVQF